MFKLSCLFPSITSYHPVYLLSLWGGSRQICGEDQEEGEIRSWPCTCERKVAKRWMADVGGKVRGKIEMRTAGFLWEASILFLVGFFFFLAPIDFTSLIAWAMPDFAISVKSQFE